MLLSLPLLCSVGGHITVQLFQSEIKVAVLCFFV